MPHLGTDLYPARADHLRYQLGTCMVSLASTGAWWLFVTASENATIEVFDHMASLDLKSCDLLSQLSYLCVRCYKQDSRRNQGNAGGSEQKM